MKKENSIKQELSYNGLTIQLFEGRPFAEIPYETESTIQAVDSTGNVVWKAEPPVPHYQQYFEIEIDDSRNLLIANTGSGFKHLIDLNNGKIVEYYLVK